MWDRAGVTDRAPEGTTTVFVEVTNTLSVDFLTGFQRHTREILRHLPGPDADGPVRVVPIRWCSRHRTYRRLTDAEAERLARPPSAVPAPPRGLRGAIDQLPAPLARSTRRMARSPIARSARQALAPARRPPAHPELELGAWPAGSIFFDLEPAWHDPRPRAELLPELVDAGVIPVPLVADVLPETHPEWFESAPAARFRGFLHAHLRLSARFLCISASTERDLRAVAAAIGEARPLDCVVTPMGSDFVRGDDPQPLPPQLLGARYALDVATFEPRKNHALLLDAFDRLAAHRPDATLVLVGKVGWKSEALLERLAAHPLLGTRLFWFERADDELLASLYRHAFVAITPSLSEGFGTPVIEALAHGVPTLSSRGGALPEAGGDLAEYFDPRDVDGLVALWERHLAQEGWNLSQRRRLEGYRAQTWADTAAAVLAALEPLTHAP
jgi:glycosyltransferase involved in cell wall biosynthesis